MTTPAADERAAERRAKAPRRWLAATAMLIPAGAALIAYRPLTDFMYRMDGHVIVVNHPIQAISAQPGEMASAAFPLRNVTPEAVTILGAETHCGCASVTNLPLTIPPGEWRDLGFRVETAASDAGTLISQDAKLFLDRPSPPVLLQINVQVTGSPPAPDPGTTSRSRS